MPVMAFLDRRRRMFAPMLVLVVVAAACETDDAADSAGPSSAAPVATGIPTPSSSEFVRVGGAPARIAVDRTIDDPTLLPYPFMSPTPAPDPTVLDGTYLRTLTLRDVGGARVGLPYRCLRCPPFRIDAGVSTLIFTRGAYYMHHQLSGFRTMGSFVVEGDRVTLFNDANCPQSPGRLYVRVDRARDEVRRGGRRLPVQRRTLVRPDVRPWIHVSACIRRIQNLWPGEVAC